MWMHSVSQLKVLHWSFLQGQNTTTEYKGHIERKKSVTVENKVIKLQE